MTLHYHPSSEDPPSDALIELLAPDGYYRYLDVPKPGAAAAATKNVAEARNASPANSSSASSSTSSGGGSNSNNNNEQQDEHHNSAAPLLCDAVPPIDEDRVRKNYRKLSRRHHPDRPGGDADTFRLLHRAKRVLLDPKLRRQYDILGVDLDDEDEDVADDDDNGNSHDIDGNGGDKTKKDGEGGSHEYKTTAQKIIQDIAVRIVSTVRLFLLELIRRDILCPFVISKRHACSSSLTLFPRTFSLSAECGYECTNASGCTNWYVFRNGVCKCCAALSF